MVESIEDLLGRKAQLNLFPMQQGDVNITYADISKAKKEIGYQPKYDFEIGLKLFVEWYSDNKKLLD
jgi:UDP-glucuronate 4-epimerase